MIGCRSRIETRYVLQYLSDTGLVSDAITQVDFFHAMFFHRPGLHTKTVWLRACNAFRGQERRMFVFVDPGEPDTPDFVAKLMIFVSCEFQGRKRKLAFIRWYTAYREPLKATGYCRMVQPETMRNTDLRRGRNVSMLCQIVCIINRYHAGTYPVPTILVIT